MNKPDLLTILLVEDDSGHARLIEKNLRRSGLCNEIIKLTDGQAALDYLFCVGEYGGRALPEKILVLLDLNMPGVNGMQVLERLKQDPMLRRLPVVILTTTDDQREIARCYELGCNFYITKPVEYERFADVIRQLGFFLAVVEVPGEH